MAEDKRGFMQLILDGLREQAAAAHYDPSGTRKAALEHVLEGTMASTVGVDSSWVESGSYDPASLTLDVRLLDGARYVYYNIRPDLGLAFFEAESKGTFINDVIKPGFFPFTRVN